MPDSLLACRRDALDAKQRGRHAQLSGELAAAAIGIEELAEGYAVRFPARPFLFLRLAEWVELERVCCSFLEIGLEFERAAGSFRVSLTGPAGAKAILRSELGLLANAG